MYIILCICRTTSYNSVYMCKIYLAKMWRILFGIVHIGSLWYSIVQSSMGMSDCDVLPTVVGKICLDMGILRNSQTVKDDPQG